MTRRNLFSLEEKVALITGGGRGIGRFIATGLAEAGADLILASRNLETLERAADELEAEFGVRVLPLVCDVGDPGAINEMLAAARRSFPRIDVLVNNAGIAHPAPTLDYPLDQWEETFQVNVRGLWLLSQGWANLMKDQRGGSLINVASIVGFKGTREEGHPFVAYSASKATVINLTQNLAVKLAPHGIRVNAIAPGYFRTDMMAFLENPALDAVKQIVLSGIPLGRAGEEDDVRGVAVFLASDASAYVTGHVLVVDGGMLTG